MPDKTRPAAKAKAARGRVTPKKQQPTPGRYTPPIPVEVRRSPRWYPWMILSLLILGVVAIILNYVDFLPDSPTNWYTLGGLVAILVGAVSATRYR